MTTCLPTSMNSVTSLRDALRRLSQAGIDAEMLKDPQILRCLPRFDRDFIALAHPHQEPPVAQQRRGLDHLADARRARRRQDAARRRMGARRWRTASALCRARHRRIALVGETEHDVREVMIEGVSGPAAHLAAQRAAGMDAVAAAAGMAERRGRAGVFGRGSGKLARAAIRRRLVRRARQVAAMPKPPSTCCSSGCAWARGRAS